MIDGLLPGFGVLLWVLFVPACLAFMIWAVVRRRRIVAEWAARNGWTVVGSDPGYATRWQGRPFRLGRNGRATEVLVGRFDGRPATSFTWQYTTGSGKNRSTVSHHVVAVALAAYLPTVELTHDGFGARLEKSLGGQDIQFESEAFNQVWRVQAAMPRSAHDIVHPRLMERLLRPDAVGLSLRIEGSDLLCWASGVQRLDAIGRYLTVLTAVADSIPRFVWLEHGYDPGAAPSATGLLGPPT